MKPDNRCSPPPKYQSSAAQHHTRAQERAWGAGPPLRIGRSYTISRLTRKWPHTNLMSDDLLKALALCSTVWWHMCVLTHTVRTVTHAQCGKWGFSHQPHRGIVFRWCTTRWLLWFHWIKLIKHDFITTYTFISCWTFIKISSLCFCLMWSNVICLYEILATVYGTVCK